MGLNEIKLDSMQCPAGGTVPTVLLRSADGALLAVGKQWTQSTNTVRLDGTVGHTVAGTEARKAVASPTNERPRLDA